MTERLRLFVASAPGLEALLCAELEALGVAEPQAVPGGVACFGDRRAIYRLNLGCGLGLRVLVRIAEFIVRDFRKLERVAAALPWEQWLSPGQAVRVRGHSKSSRLYHSRAIAERVERGIAARIGGEARPDRAEGPGGGDLRDAGDPALEPTLIQVRMVRDRCTISVDTTGPLLHKRGWRQQPGKAPLREDLARALLAVAGWRPGMALFDPLCGSGTLVIEAATQASGRPPGRGRRFALMDQPGFNGELFATLAGELSGEPCQGASLLGADRNAGAVAAATANAARAEVADTTGFLVRSLGARELPELAALGDGLALITNPPWGQRTGDPGRLRNLYASLGKLARALPRPLAIGLATPEPALAHATRLGLEQRIRSDQGGVKLGLWTGRLE